MAAQKEKRYNNGYRMSDKFIKGWTRALVTILIAGIGGCFAVLIYTAIAYGDAATEDLPSWIVPTMISLGAIGLGIPLILGAILGGLAIHRFGWIPLLLAMGGLLTIGASAIDGLGFLAPYSVAAMVIGVIGIFVLAAGFTEVPIWFGLPMLHSPRLYVRGKEKEVEATKKSRKE